MAENPYPEPSVVCELVAEVIRDLGGRRNTYASCCTQFAKLVRSTDDAVVQGFGAPPSVRKWASNRLDITPRPDKLLQFMKLAYHHRAKCASSLQRLASDEGVQHALRAYYGEGDSDLEVLEVIGAAEYPKERRAYRLPLKRYHYISNSMLRSLYAQLLSEDPPPSEWMGHSLRHKRGRPTPTVPEMARMSQESLKGDGGASRVALISPVIQRLEEAGQIGQLEDGMPYFRWSGEVGFLRGHVDVVHYTGVHGTWRFLLFGLTRNMGMRYTINPSATFPFKETDNAFVDAVMRKPIEEGQNTDPVHPTLRHASEDEICEAMDIVHSDPSRADRWIHVELVAAVNEYDRRERFRIAHGVPLFVSVQPREREEEAAEDAGGD